VTSIHPLAPRNPWVALFAIAALVAALVVIDQTPADAASPTPTAAAAANCSVGQSGAAIPRQSSGVDAVRTTIGVAKSMGVSPKGQVIAVMVMYQESSIRNLANDGSSVQASSWPSPGRAYWINVTKLSLKYPHDRFGLANGAHDTDSIGLYQQRPAWGWGNYGSSTGTTDPEGAVQRLLDPRWEAMAFFGGSSSAAPTSGLLDVNGWENMAPTDAAEAVQGSTQGDLYAKWEIPATNFVNNNQDAPPIGLPWFPGGGGGALSCTSIPTDPNLGEAGRNPMGHVDSASATDTQINVVGWSLDPDAIDGVVSVRASDTGPSGITRTVDGLADLARPDVERGLNVVGEFGFDLTLPISGIGRHTVCVTATNIGRGTSDSQLGCTAVDALGPVGACGGDANNPVPSGVGAARTDSGISIVVRGNDDAVWVRSINPDTSYQSLGGQIQYGPALASSGGDRLDLFVVGMNGALFHRAGSANGQWNGWESLGGILTASPAVVSFASNSLNIYGRGADGQLWTIAWTGTGWSPWSPVGGLLFSGPGAAVDRDTGRATVGVRGGDGSLYELRFGAAGPGSYVKVGTPICSAPAYAARTGDGDTRTPAFRAKDGSLSVAGTSIGGYAASAPALVLDPTGPGVSVFVRGGNGALWLYQGPPGAGSWSSLGGGLN
jgi:hypothetical protein